ncbi:MAG: hypothetical protein ACI4XP_04525 [Acutalibacteraceae bacterium]
MIKGINHSIIEVNNTGSEYYERAILIIKPEYASVQHDILEQEARKILGEMGVPSSLKRNKNKAKKIALFISAALFGAAVTTLCFLI